MRNYIDIMEAMWDTENWWEPKLDPLKGGNYGPGDHHPDGMYARFGVPEEVENRYSNGQCTWLALAMAKRYGWQIKAEMMRHEPTHIAHAFCVMPNGKQIDILGPQDAVDSFEGGPVKSFTYDQMMNWLKENDSQASNPVEFNDHMDDAQKAVELFIAPKVEDIS